MTEYKIVYVIVTPEVAKMSEDEFFQEVFPYATQYKSQESAKKILRKSIKTRKESVEQYEDWVKRVKAGTHEFFEQSALPNLERLLAESREGLEKLEKTQIKAVEIAVSYAFKD